MALALAMVTVVVASSYHLPLRDPDGVAVPDVRPAAGDPAARLPDRRGAPRGLARPVGRCRLPRTLVAVTRERWPWEHIRFALVGLGAWYLTYAAFRNLKSFVPFVNRDLWDTTARAPRPGPVARPRPRHRAAPRVRARLGRAVLLLRLRRLDRAGAGHPGRRAGLVARPDRAARGTSRRSPSTGCSASRRTSRCRRWDRSTPSRRTSPRSRTPTSPRSRTSMINDRYTVLADPFATHAVQTIAAFASLHVGIMVTVCLMAELLRMRRWVRVTMWVFLGAHRARDGLPRLALLRRHPRAARCSAPPACGSPRSAPATTTGAVRGWSAERCGRWSPADPGPASSAGTRWAPVPSAGPGSRATHRRPGPSAGQEAVDPAHPQARAMPSRPSRGAHGWSSTGIRAPRRDERGAQGSWQARAPRSRAAYSSGSPVA